jgi:hypothetical protein
VGTRTPGLYRVKGQLTNTLGNLANDSDRQTTAPALPQPETASTPSLDAALAQALSSSAQFTDIRFDASGKVPFGEQSAQFCLYIDPRSGSLRKTAAAMFKRSSLSRPHTFPRTARSPQVKSRILRSLARWPNNLEIHPRPQS